MNIRAFLRKLATKYETINKIKLLRWKFLMYYQQKKSYIMNSVREGTTEPIQNILLRLNHPSNIKKLIIFLTPGRDVINGGVLSILSIYNETKQLKNIHRSKVIVCTLPGDPLLLKYTKVDKKHTLYRFSQVLNYFKNIKSLTLHIPEYSIGKFLNSISLQTINYLSQINDLHINVMLQNILQMAPMEHVERLGQLGRMTCTTAHAQYSTFETRKNLGFPLHKLSTYVSPEQYDKKSYSKKGNLLIVSPDKHPRKKEILNTVAKYFPQLEIQLIQGLSYRKYKKVISKAKWALTFGEGLDGYFIEPIFSGAISFSVYNSNFFTSDFKTLHTVYDNYDSLLKKICVDMKNLDKQQNFNDYQKQQFAICCKHYDYRQYIKNLELFYLGDYTYK